MNYEETEGLKETVETDTEMKNWLVNYVGEKHDPDSGEVTVEMIVETMATEFPEFLMVILPFPEPPLGVTAENPNPLIL